MKKKGDPVLYFLHLVGGTKSIQIIEYTHACTHTTIL